MDPTTPFDRTQAAAVADWIKANWSYLGQRGFLFLAGRYTEVATTGKFTCGQVAFCRTDDGGTAPIGEGPVPGLPIADWVGALVDGLAGVAAQGGVLVGIIVLGLIGIRRMVS